VDGQLTPYRVSVQDHWVDYNDHLNEGYYGVVFSDAGDHVLSQLGFSEEYRSGVGGTFYTAETHTRYLAEVSADAEIAVVSLVVGVDSKRLHLWHDLRTDGRTAATQESMILHVGIDSGRVAPMPDDFVARARSLVVFGDTLDLCRSIRRVGR